MKVISGFYLTNAWRKCIMSGICNNNSLMTVSVSLLVAMLKLKFMEVVVSAFEENGEKSARYLLSWRIKSIKY